jgi:fructose-1,6-bisphosphatase I
MGLIEKFSAPLGTFLDRFIAANQEQFPFASGELSQLLRDIALAAKIINKEINRAGLVGIEGEVGNKNVQGEDQKMLDMVAHIRFKRALCNGKQTCGILSEETDEIIDTKNHQAKYVVSLDPLDGSSNIHVNMPIGTIFSIYRRVSPQGKPPAEEDFLQKGIHQVAAGYVIYGTSMILVYTTGFGVNGFTYEPSLGEFILSHPDIRIKTDGNTLSINQENFHTFSTGVKSYLDHCKVAQYKTIYTGALVADFHRNLFTGGIYSYPSSEKYKTGKLRLLYECMPLAFIVEQAGGGATNGQIRTMEILPASKHQRSPLFIGSKNMVAKVTDCIANSK